MTWGAMRSLNLGILAHVDAGKTSLSEQLLHHAGVIDRVGRGGHRGGGAHRGGGGGRGAGGGGGGRRR